MYLLFSPHNPYCPHRVRSTSRLFCSCEREHHRPTSHEPSRLLPREVEEDARSLDAIHKFPCFRFAVYDHPYPTVDWVAELP